MTEQTEIRGDSVVWIYDDSDNMYIQNACDSPHPVGYYDLDGFQIGLDKKPRWLHRQAMRWVFGWKWVD